VLVVGIITNGHCTRHIDARVPCSSRETIAQVHSRSVGKYYESV